MDLPLASLLVVLDMAVTAMAMEIQVRSAIQHMKPSIKNSVKVTTKRFVTHLIKSNAKMWRGGNVKQFIPLIKKGSASTLMNCCAPLRKTYNLKKFLLCLQFKNAIRGRNECVTRFMKLN